MTDAGVNGAATDDARLDGDLLEDDLQDDDLQDDDLLDEERELYALDTSRPSEHQLAGGAPRSLAWMLLIGGILGIVASMELVLSEMELLENPDATLSCDLNPVIGCGASLTLWQSHLFFGIPNALVGVAVFGMVSAVGAMFLAGARVATWFWRLMCVAILGGLAFVAWFAVQSMTVIGYLCPWCMVTWAVVFVLAFEVLGRSAQAGHLPIGTGAARVLFTERRLFTVLAFLIVIVAAAVVFWNKWLLMFGL